MLEGLETEWAHPEDEAVAWDSEDGRYVVSTLDSFDLVDQYLELDSDQLLDDIADQLGDCEWCQRNPYRLTREEAWSSDEGAGYHVTVTGNSARALAIAKREAFDLIVVDNWMPGLWERL